MRICYRLDGMPMEEQIKQVDWDRKCDIVVVGLGTAGAIASIIAAESGLQTMGIEALSGMGGQGTLGLIWDYYYGVSGGRFEKINSECGKMTAQGYVTSKHAENDESYPGYIKDYLLEETFIQAGGCLLEETIITGVYLCGNVICGVRCVHRHETMSICAKIVIDATGNAIVAEMINCPLLPFRLTDNKAQTHSHTVSVYQDKGYMQTVYTHSGQMSPTNNQSVTQAYLLSAAHEFCLERQFPGQMVSDGRLLGIREGKRVDSLENISLESAVSGSTCEHPLFYVFSHVDNLSRDIAFENRVQQDWNMIAGMWTVGVTIPISMKTLLPKHVDGLIMAGKCIGIEHDITGCIRMKRDMEKCGEAAAIMACACVQRNTSPRLLSYDHIVDQLIRNGCLSTSSIQWLDLRAPVDSQARKIRMPETADQIEQGLASDNPGIAMWKLRSMSKDRVLPLIMQYLDSDNALVRDNSVLAAGMLGYDQSIPKLREMARRMPQPAPFATLKYNYPIACKAICLLGRMADIEIIPWLLHIIENPKIFDDVPLYTDTFCPTKDDVYFQYFSNAFLALLHIMHQHPATWDTVMPRLEKIVFSPNLSFSITRGHINPADSIRMLLHKFKNHGVIYSHPIN